MRSHALMLTRSTAFGRYVIRRQIGRGGMADVYEAEMRAAEGAVKRVALKLLHTEHGNRNQSVSSFTDEATLAAKLSHPNIVSVFDFGKREGTLFIAMEYIDGWDLRQLIGRCNDSGQTMPVPATVYIVHEVTQALDYIHTFEPPIVHRDVTPHNIFVTRDGHIKLGDFGIAKSALRQSYTVSGQIKGKLSYLAPEQVTGDPITARTDIYAAGLVIYELATGERLLQADSEVELIRLAENPRVFLPSKLNPRAGPLDPLVQRALQPHPTLRFPSARVLSEHLHRLLHQEPFGAPDMARLSAELERAAAEQGAVSAPKIAPKPTGTLPLIEGQAADQRPGWRKALVLVLAGAVIAGAVGLTVFLSRQDSQVRRLLTLAPDAARRPSSPADSRIDATPPVPDATVDAAPTPTPTPTPRRVKRPARRLARRTRPAPRSAPPPPPPSEPAEPAPKPAPKVIEPAPPLVDTQASKRRLQELMNQAAQRGLWPDDWRDYADRLGDVRLAISRRQDATAALDELQRLINGFVIDRRFAEAKLKRLERAISRARLSEAERQELSAREQKILSLIFGHRLVEASRLITGQMRSLTRREKSRGTVSPR